jgi:hypothetical protein
MTTRRILDLNRVRRNHRTFEEGQNTGLREVEGRRDGSVLPVGQGDVKKKRAL